MMGSIKPKLVVFDLDYTLWPFCVAIHVTPPLKKLYAIKSSNTIIDSYDREIKCYQEVPAVLNKLHEQGYILAVASRTAEMQGALQLIKLFGWDKYLIYKQIYPGSKTTHFEKFKKQTGLGFEDMILFDDEERNITDLKNLGVTSILVKNGVTKAVVENGLKEYVKQHP